MEYVNDREMAWAEKRLSEKNWWASCEQPIIKKLAVYSLAHWDDGFDTFSECYALSEWQEFVGNFGKPFATYEDALNELKADAARIVEQRSYAANEY
tara:strand:- start:476 stop:766 length:291 start_codon:yes stop_codon:yes gene_type:complete